MNNEPSIVKKTESALDDLLDLWRRRKLVCIIVLAVIILPACFTLYQQFVVVPKLKSEVSTLKTQKREAEQKRDKAELQLAPFLAIAKSNFPDTPEDQRLDELSEKLDRIIAESKNADRSILLKLRTIEETIGGIQQGTTVSTTKRVISEAVAKRLTSSLKDITDYDVDINCVMGDAEGFALAEQIKEIFSKTNWKVTGVGQSIFSKPITGLIVEFGKQPPAVLQRALLPLFDNLGYPREANLNPKVPGNRLKIIVGGK